MVTNKAERKARMREEAKKKIYGAGGGVTGSRQYRERVEQGRKRLLQKSSEGGDKLAQRVKGELNYLINNYVPAHDARIATLIDQWRTSGDPEYSPEVKVRYLKARQRHMKEHAL